MGQAWWNGRVAVACCCGLRVERRDGCYRCAVRRCRCVESVWGGESVWGSVWLQWEKACRLLGVVWGGDVR